MFLKMGLVTLNQNHRTKFKDVIEKLHSLRMSVKKIHSSRGLERNFRRYINSSKRTQSAVLLPTVPLHNCFSLPNQTRTTMAAILPHSHVSSSVRSSHAPSLSSRFSLSGHNSRRSLRFPSGLAVIRDRISCQAASATSPPSISAYEQGQFCFLRFSK